MTHPRGLSKDEAEAWEKLAATVTRLHSPAVSNPFTSAGGAEAEPVAETRRSAPQPAQGRQRKTTPSDRRAAPSGGLDGHRDRKLNAGRVEPDFTLDLHGHGLDAAYRRLMSGVAQARAMEARTVLLVTGKSRPVDPADRGSRRGAIRAKVLDWLAASEHASAIAAVRHAHTRHGGEGALYIVLKRQR